MKRLAVLVALSLAACVAPAPQLVPVSDAEVIRRADGITATASWSTATAVTMATQNALATADRRRTEQAAADGYTATANTAGLAQTQRADGYTATAIVLGFEQTQAAATREALSQMRADSATQIAVNARATGQAQYTLRQQQFGAAMNGLIIVLPILICAIVLWYARDLARSLATRYRPENDPGGVRVVRVQGGTLIIAPTPHGVRRELLASPGGDEPADAFDTDEEIAETPAEPAGTVFTSVPLRRREDTLAAADEVNRRFVLRFLSDAITVAGPGSVRVPDHRTMQYASETWQSATALIAEHVTSKKRGRHGGTLLDCTLAELLSAVGERRFIPRVTVEHAPAPSRAPAPAEQPAQ